MQSGGKYGRPKIHLQSYNTLIYYYAEAAERNKKLITS